MAQIECRKLSKEYHKGDTVIRPLDKLDLDVDEGKFISLMGPSGSGKTHLLMALSKDLIENNINALEYF